MQAIYLIGAILLIAIGVLLTFSPIPFGAFLVVGGLSMLLAVSRRARAFMRLERRLHPSLDRFLGRAEEKVPHVIAAPLERTDGDEARRLHAQKAMSPEGRDRARRAKARAKHARVAAAHIASGEVRPPQPL